MSRKKRGVRVRIEFTKKNGKRTSFWTDAPEDWDRPASPGANHSWADTAAAKYHPGATDAEVTGRE